MIENLKSGGVEILLLYDGYRRHLALKTMRLFGAHSVFAYALSAHTRGKTQPLDLCV